MLHTIYMHVLFTYTCLFTNIYVYNRPGEMGNAHLPKAFQQRLNKTGSLYVHPGAVRTDSMKGYNVRDESGSGSSRYIYEHSYMYIYK
jgi:hypothetical protein